MSRSWARTALRWHALVFVLCVGFLVTINLVFSPGVLWVLWVAGPWAIALSLHAFGVLSSNAEDTPSELRASRRSLRAAARLGSAPTRLSDVPPVPLSGAPTEHASPRAPEPASTSGATLPATLQVGQRVADRFVIERVLGAGGMGVVYVAHDATLDEKVALKTIAATLVGADAVDRFRREAQAARRITHPNVVRIHDIGQDGTLSFISMEYVEGQSLAQRIHAQGALPMSDVKRIALELCAGLQAAHEAGVTHRDLKPDNVLIDGKGQVRVIDFGLARVDAHSGLTATGAVMGTPGYMAPEQVMGKGADARTDIYALGCILYHALTGVPPFTRDSAIAVGFAHCYDTPPPLSTHRADIDRDWQSTVMRALEKEPGQRFQSVTDLRAVISGLSA